MALSVCDLHMEECSPMTTATSGAPNVLRNEVVPVYVATTTQQLDIVSNVCVEDCNRGPPGNLLQIPMRFADTIANCVCKEGLQTVLGFADRIFTHDCKAVFHTINLLNLFQDYQMRHVQHSNLQLQMVKQRTQGLWHRSMRLWHRSMLL